MIPLWSVPIPSSSSARIIPLEILTAQLGLAQLGAVGHDRAGPGHGDDLAGGHVGGAADDLGGLAAAGLDQTDAEAVGVGVALGRQHAPDDEEVQAVDAVVLDPLDLGAGHGQALGQLLGVLSRGGVVVEPVQGNAHASGH